jgi:predicted nucleotidyltransferase
VSEAVTVATGVQFLEGLPQRVREALAAFQQALLGAFPGQIRRIILYGSYARGEAAPDSDVDVMIVVAWEEERLPDGFYRSMYGDPRWERIVDLATDVNLDFGIYISPMVIGQSRFEEWSPLMYSVRREGVELWSLRARREDAEQSVANAKDFLAKAREIVAETVGLKESENVDRSA